MLTVADNVYLLRGRPPNLINVYLAGDVLVDAGTPARAQADPARATRAAS